MTTQVHVNLSDYLKSDLVRSISTPNFITSAIMLPMAASQFNLFLLLNNKLTLLPNHSAYNYLLSFANLLVTHITSDEGVWDLLSLSSLCHPTTLNSDIILITTMVKPQQLLSQIFVLSSLHISATNAHFNGASYRSAVLFVICFATQLISTDLSTPIVTHLMNTSHNLSQLAFCHLFACQLIIVVV